MRSVYGRAARVPHQAPCSRSKPGPSGDELDLDGTLEGARFLAATKELGDRLAPLLAVVLGQLVDVHAHELVGELRGQAAAVPERVGERPLPGGGARPDRVRT